MKDFYLSLICVGFDDSFLYSLNMDNIHFFRKGEFWRKRTGQKYKDNIARLSLTVSKEKGYGETLDNLKTIIENEGALSALLQDCREVEVQFSASLDDENQMPHLHLTVFQIEFLLKINAEIDIHVT